MAVPFAKTLSFLDADERSGVGRTVLVAGLLLTLWIVWMITAQTTVYAVSDEGRLLAAGAASPIQTPVAGVIAETHLTLGAEVKAGEILVELDSSAEKLRLDEEQTRTQGLTQAVEGLEQIIEAELGLADATARAGASRVSSAAAKARVTADIAALTKQQNDAYRRLKEASLVSGLEAMKAAEDMQRQRGQVTISRAETALAAADYDRVRKETEVRVLNLQKELTELKARIAASRVVMAQLDWEIARRKLRSPVDGVVADVTALPQGAAVGAIQTLATIVPHTRMRWIAYFPAREAVGRIHNGQTARIRLDAFPWTAYGPLTATVTGVGSEPREQRVRVELDLTGENTAVPLSHGMTGVTDVEVERMSPLRLLLRLSGQSMQGRGRAVPEAPRAPASSAPSRP
jgi:multidrug resistance efflux pump